MAILFVYGTLKRGFYNYHLLADKTNGSSVFIGTAKLNDAHVLVTMPDNGIPCLLPLQHDKPSEGIQPVHGELFEIDESMLARLDELEECPTWYNRVQTTCSLLESESDKYQRGSVVPCQVYLKTNPSPEYYSRPSICSFVEDNDFLPKTMWHKPNTYHKLLVYGTLKRGFHNFHIISDKANGVSVFIGEAKLQDPHGLVIHPRNGIPYLLPNTSNTHAEERETAKPKEVYGELFEVDDAMIAVLDKFEQCPVLYTRTETTCVLLSSESDKYEKDSRVSCTAYMKTDPGSEYYSLPYINSFPRESSIKYVPKGQRN